MSLVKICQLIDWPTFHIGYRHEKRFPYWGCYQIHPLREITFPFRDFAPLKSKRDASIVSVIERLIEPSKICIVSGDLNLKFLTDSNNVIINALQRLKFTQFIDQPTHIQGGIIDHLYMRQPHIYREVEIISDLVAVFYSDHIGIQITFLKNENEFKHIENSVPDQYQINLICMLILFLFHVSSLTHNIHSLYGFSKHTILIGKYICNL